MKISILITSLLALPVFRTTHDTSIEVLAEEPTKDASHFVVQVTRQQELLDDDELKATQTQVVIFNFDVKSEQLLVNDKVVSMGLSQVQVEAATMVGTADDFDMDKAIDQLDVGIVDIEIEAVGETVERDGMILRQIHLTERVVAVNGEKVEQEETSQLAIQVFPDGSFAVGKPDCMGQATLDFSWPNYLQMLLGGGIFLTFMGIGFSLSKRMFGVDEPESCSKEKGLPKYQPVESPPPYAGDH